MNNSTLPHSPKGFTVSHSKQGYLLVSYRTTGMGCLFVFNLTWLILWTIVCIVLIIEIVEQGQFVDLKLIVLLFFFISLELLILARTLYFFYGVKQYELQGERLIYSKGVGFIKRQKTISKSKINRVQQIKDGGQRYNSFPSWGLLLDLHNGQDYKILSRQPVEKSEWLGKLVAAWAKVEYVPSQYRHKKVWNWKLW